MNKGTIAFGTCGIRSHADRYPFTADALHALGKAFGEWSVKRYGKEIPKVLIGCDTRESGPRVKADLIAGLQTFPVTIVDGGILSTPAVCQLIHYQDNFDFGIVISASHNPYYDNGIKIYDAKRTHLLPEDEETIVALFAEHYQDSSLQKHEQSSVKIWEESVDSYIKTIDSFFSQNFLEGKKVVLDCANGATFAIAPQIFEHFGAMVETISTFPDGKNINENCGALHPQDLQRAVIEQQADLGFAFDGDGDRVLAVNSNGELIDGDDILALLSLTLNDTTVVGTLMTNLGFELYLEENNKKLLRTAVGDKYIFEKMEELNLSLGGEASGHIIIRDYLNGGDGVFVALNVAKLFAENENRGMKLFSKIPQVLINVPVINKNDLSQAPYAQLIQEHENKLDKGRVLVRYSGTENVLRVMTEAQHQGQAQDVAQNLANALKQQLDR